MMSGPRINGFREGWALAMFGKMAHYYRRDEAAGVYPACGGSRGKPAGYLFHAGSYPLCKRCVRKAAKDTPSRPLEP